MKPFLDELTIQNLKIIKVIKNYPFYLKYYGNVTL